MCLIKRNGLTFYVTYLSSFLLLRYIEAIFQSKHEAQQLLNGPKQY